jgi:hypothetical protein
MGNDVTATLLTTPAYREKRRGCIERFVAELGADELVELRSRLVEDDGAVKPLGEMVEEKSRANGA